MPYLKQIASHTNCQNIQRYLEKSNRALAKDFFNLSVDERDGYGDECKDGIHWADEMDALRHSFGNDRPFGTMKARTYKHFIVSPDPEDGIDLDSLRELACEWALEHFGEYQIAIVYHDDNESRIPHAHVVVNNTNLRTGRRMHHDDPKAFNRRLQEMAKERKLKYMTDDAEPTEGLERLAALKRRGKTKPRTMQQVHLGRAERELVESGGYSWVADIRNRVSVAKSLARNESEFHQILGILGVKAEENSRSSKRDDWIYSLLDTPTWRVSGERLGLLFSKGTISRQLARAGSYRPDTRSSREILLSAQNAVLLNDLAELDQLSTALKICAQHNVSSLQACDRKLAVMRNNLKSSDGKSNTKQQVRIEELETARKYMAKRNLLPARLESPASTRAKNLQSQQEKTSSEEPRAKQQKIKQKERQRNEAEGRTGR